MIQEDQEVVHEELQRPVVEIMEAQIDICGEARHKWVYFGRLDMSRHMLGGSRLAVLLSLQWGALAPSLTVCVSPARVPCALAKI